MTSVSVAIPPPLFYDTPVAHENRSCALTIAGFDPTGGAGISADSRVFEAHGLQAFAVITTLIPQTPDRVLAVHPVSLNAFGQQLEAAEASFDIRAIKIGALGSAEFLAPLQRFLERHPTIPTVADPVLTATDGTVFLHLGHRQEFLERIGRAVTLLTPNRSEAFTLADLTSSDAPLKAAERLAEMGIPAILIKSAREADTSVADLLFIRRQAQPIWMESPRRTKVMPHGCGCHLSSAIASRLGCGDDLETAVRMARDWFQTALDPAQSPSSTRPMFRTLPTVVSHGQ
jgi:hydroxymethylpyrimidine kinase/phosphomethylpyrimidine kinase